MKLDINITTLQDTQKTFRKAQGNSQAYTTPHQYGETERDRYNYKCVQTTTVKPREDQHISRHIKSKEFETVQKDLLTKKFKYR